ncbi:carbohydrate-binding protein [Streptomyces yaizuensis]|uniref:Carbohydrate-binding protein n=1 Tax=Streptomyces yaizuensis TaxID=2989713 RepID=A0ABQ5P3V7_9ACTN|nr:carbohydrate-binding protein [Streptomyces sp. YSPA8]GLF97133.1 carbohydrate-binding protein [Streptomyces sp. YSPA8]
MTAGNNGASTPEDDDPFGYLYEDGNAAGATSPSGRGRGYGYPGPGTPQPGVPRTSYNHVRAVGERTYGGHHAPHQQQAPQQQPYGQPHAQYAAPETYPGGAPTRPVPPQSGSGSGGRGRGPNTKVLMIAAVAVVLAVVAGITAAVINNTGGDKDQADGDKQPAAQVSASAPAEPGEPKDELSPPPSPTKSAGLPKEDAATLRLGGPARAENTIKGAKGTGNAYVTFNGTGSSAAWSLDVPEGGDYTLHITFNVPGKNAQTSLTVNDEAPRSIRMDNFAGAGDGEWDKWTYTYSYMKLPQGKNDLKISCESGDSCDALLIDQVWLTAGHTRR